jgi:hypothetical protein
MDTDEHGWGQIEIPNTKIQIPRKSKHQDPRGGNFVAETQRTQRNAEEETESWTETES